MMSSSFVYGGWNTSMLRTAVQRFASLCENVHAYELCDYQPYESSDGSWWPHALCLCSMDASHSCLVQVVLRIPTRDDHLDRDNVFCVEETAENKKRRYLFSVHVKTWLAHLKLGKDEHPISLWGWADEGLEQTSSSSSLPEPFVSKHSPQEWVFLSISSNECDAESKKPQYEVRIDLHKLTDRFPINESQVGGLFGCTDPRFWSFECKQPDNTLAHQMKLLLPLQPDRCQLEFRRGVCQTQLVRTLALSMRFQDNTQWRSVLVTGESEPAAAAIGMADTDIQTLQKSVSVAHLCQALVHFWSELKQVDGEKTTKRKKKLKRTTLLQKEEEEEENLMSEEEEVSGARCWISTDTDEASSVYVRHAHRHITDMEVGYMLAPRIPVGGATVK